jgi:hypothetical protein
MLGLSPVASGRKQVSRSCVGCLFRSIQYQCVLIDVPSRQRLALAARRRMPICKCVEFNYVGYVVTGNRT